MIHRKTIFVADMFESFKMITTRESLNGRYDVNVCLYVLDHTIIYLPPKKKIAQIDTIIASKVSTCISEIKVYRLGRTHYPTSNASNVSFSFVEGKMRDGTPDTTPGHFQSCTYNWCDIYFNIWPMQRVSKK